MDFGEGDGEDGGEGDVEDVGDGDGEECRVSGEDGDDEGDKDTIPYQPIPTHTNPY